MENALDTSSKVIPMPTVSPPRESASRHRESFWAAPPIRDAGPMKAYRSLVPFTHFLLLVMMSQRASMDTSGAKTRGGTGGRAQYWRAWGSALVVVVAVVVGVTRLQAEQFLQGSDPPLHLGRGCGGVPVRFDGFAVLPVGTPDAPIRIEHVGQLSRFGT